MEENKNKLARPPWLRIRIAHGSGREEVNNLLADLKLNTVCGGAKCPNMGECFHKRTATFLILGKHCTRDCKFCAIGHAPNPPPPEEDEPQRVAEAASKLNLNYVVVTSVTRDDLPDGGAGHFARTAVEIKKRLPESRIEVLTPDFKDDRAALKTVLSCHVSVFNHNIETVKRLSGLVRYAATYERSLAVLRAAYEYAGDKIPVKSGIMVGLGEKNIEIEQTMLDLYAHGVRLLTIGQYLSPSKTHWPVAEYVVPEQFDRWRQLALEIGFRAVAASPLVRSSYAADELASQM